MQFDVIIGNPPFQNDKNDAGTGSLWKQFVDFLDFVLKKSHDCTCKNGITSPAARFEEVSAYQKHLSFNVKMHFQLSVDFNICQYFLGKMCARWIAQLNHMM